MSLDLPAIIASYFAADRINAESVAQCFTDNAVVTDERATYSGRSAIKQWKTATSQKYTYTITPLSLQETQYKTIVTTRLAGNFPGSPVDVRHIFGLEGEKIATLEIKP